MPRRSAKNEIPEHYERLRLAAGPRLGLRAAAVLLVAAALAAGLAPHGSTLLSLAGGALALLAAAAVVAAIRLTACEVIVTRISLKVGFGPFGAAYPVWGVRPGTARPATGWRRLYAQREVAVAIDDPRGGHAIAVPSSETDELIAALHALAPAP
jgi:hypothetical protein